MGTRTLKIGLFSLVQIAVVTLIWRALAPDPAWNIVQQFYGHLGPASFLVAMGVATFLERDNLKALIQKEAILAIIAGAAYILADTFIMHPPFGVFDGAGQAESEHVSIMALIIALGISALVLLRRQGDSTPPSVHFVIGAAVASMVFLSHQQHTVAGTVGHSATIVLLVIASLFRMMGKIQEYGVVLVVTGFVFFASQMGLAGYVDSIDYSPGAWFAFWATGGFLSATIYMTMSPKPEAPDE